MSSVSIAGAQAIRRALDVARTVAQIQRSGANLSRIAKATGLSVPTAHRILRSLTEERLLTFDPADRCYRLGLLAFELGLAAPPEARVEASWRGAIEAVAARTRLTSYLIAQSDDEAVCLFCAQGSATIRAMPMEVGQRVPLGLGAGSLAILASLDDGEVERIVTGHKDRYALFAGGPQQPDAILRRVAETRGRGYAISAGTVASGVTGIGLLVASGSTMTRLAVTVSAVASAFGEKEAGELVVAISRSISDQGLR
jgi:DNA-binding IclR family transcriptional regulator